jgi:hypothetical protein
MDTNNTPNERVEMTETECALNERVETVVEKHLPKIQKFIKEKIAPSVLLAMQNDEMMQSLLAPIYEALPLPIRLVVKKEAFVKFCFKHRDKLIS